MTKDKHWSEEPAEEAPPLPPEELYIDDPEELAEDAPFRLRHAPTDHPLDSGIQEEEL